MKQRVCIEGGFNFPNPVGKGSLFLYFTHDFIGIEQNRLALFVENRLAIQEMVDCLG